MPAPAFRTLHEQDRSGITQPNTSLPWALVHPCSADPMSLFESLSPDACQSLVGGNILKAVPSEAYALLLQPPTNYGLYKNEYTGPGEPNNPASWYGAGTNDGQFVKAAD